MLLSSCQNGASIGGESAPLVNNENSNNPDVNPIQDPAPVVDPYVLDDTNTVVPDGVDMTKEGDGDAFVSDPSLAKTIGCGVDHTPGTFAKTITVQGVLRNYKIIIPANYDKNFEYSVVFAYHGSSYSNTPDTMISQTSTLRNASLKQGIFIYPDGHVNGVAKYWDKKATGKDVLMFDALLYHMKKYYCLDKSRVFVTGFSDGGGMANVLGCHRSTKVKGVAEASGYFAQGSACGNLPMPFLIWHGTADTITNYTQYAVPEIAHWVSANGCTTAKKTIPPTSEACKSYTNCSNAPLITCTPARGHEYPSAMGAPIWNFFQGL